MIVSLWTTALMASLGCPQGLTWDLQLSHAQLECCPACQAGQQLQGQLCLLSEQRKIGMLSPQHQRRVFQQHQPGRTKLSTRWDVTSIVLSQAGETLFENLRRQADHCKTMSYSTSKISIEVIITEDLITKGMSQCTLASPEGEKSEQMRMASR